MRFDGGRRIAYAREVDPEIRVMQMSAETGAGMEAWCDWLRHGRAQQPNLVPA